MVNRYFYFFLVFLILGVASCRKVALLPEPQNFKSGVYVYHLYADDTLYENAYQMVIGQHALEKEPVVFQLKHSFMYDIPFFEDQSLSTLMPYISQGFYSYLHAGIYVRSSNSWSTNNVLKVPAYRFIIDSLQVPRKCDDKKYDLVHRIERDQRLTIQGREYETYKMEIHGYFNCKNTERHTLYVDEHIGIVRYEVREVGRSEYLYRLDFVEKR